MEVSWTILKAFITAKSLPVQYADNSELYYVWISDTVLTMQCRIYKDSGTDQTDFETNYKPTANLSYKAELVEAVNFDIRDLVAATDSVSAAIISNTGTLTDLSGTATSASSTVASANSSRKYFFIQNLGNQAIWFNFTTDATAASPSIQLNGGDAFEMSTPGYVSTEKITVIRGGGSNISFVAKEG